MLNFEMLDQQAWPMVKDSLSQMYRAGLDSLEKYAAGH
jgi:hypothetical protein